MDETDEDALSSEFAKELAKGMESLMREIAGEADGSTAASGGDDVSEEERARAFKAAWEAMLVEGMDGNLGEGGFEGLAQASSKGAAPKSKEGAAGAGGFQDKIKQAMDKMKESESKMQVCPPHLRMSMEWVCLISVNRERPEHLVRHRLPSRLKRYCNLLGILAWAKAVMMRWSFLVC